MIISGYECPRCLAIHGDRGIYCCGLSMSKAKARKYDTVSNELWDSRRHQLEWANCFLPKVPCSRDEIQPRADIQDIYELESSVLMGYMSRGHFAPEQFHQSISAEYGGDVVLLEGWERSLKMTYFRNRPCGDGMTMDEVNEMGKGAYPATWLDAVWTSYVKEGEGG